MKFSIPIEHITPADKDCVGGKAYSLSALNKQGFRIPYALSVTTEAYNHYTHRNGLHERISLELHRKNFHEMRWEEMWDASLRIRNMFLTSKLPDDLEQNLRGLIEKIFSGKAVVVRSSAPGEDSAGASFAGLHDSFVNIKGADAILYHIRMVWASLWSDAALLYRQELGLDVTKSTMAVLVQEIIKGEKSGVVFSQNPDDETQAVIESVYGLNQGLVDGTVEPDRWFLARESGRVVSHIPALRDKIMAPAPEGTTLVQLPKKIQALPPLNSEETARVFALAMQSEIVWGYPQDVEWTFHNDQLYTLQSRPITTIGQGRSGDERPWYLSLKRSFENLKTLRKKIEDELIPQMEGVANELARIDLNTLSDEELIGQIKEREAIFDHWEKVYWSDFIPFAHGMRLFGQVYNDTIRPEDPYEFMDLLSGAGMVSLRRNSLLEELADFIRNDEQLRQTLEQNREFLKNEDFSSKLDSFVESFGDLSCSTAQCFQGSDAVIRILLELASRPKDKIRTHDKNTEELSQNYLSHFPDDQQAFAAELLDLASASYRLRDNDNMYLGRIEGQMLYALREGLARINSQGTYAPDSLSAKEVIRMLQDPNYTPKTSAQKEEQEQAMPFKSVPRQLTGQPAGPGVCQGLARVILSPADLAAFKAGEIMICDAIDPNMTFVVPLAAGIVERRGGMLIHGAIIAREYGLPCVTGVPDATALIKTGDALTVDGYLGIVVIGT